MPTGVRRAGTASARLAPAVPGQDDGVESGATDAIGRPLPGHGASTDQNQSPPSFSHSPESGYRVTGAGR
jgi:hypothetical protein